MIYAKSMTSKDNLLLIISFPVLQFVRYPILAGYILSCLPTSRSRSSFYEACQTSDAYGW